MKVQLLIPFSVSVSIAALGLFQFRAKEMVDVEKRDKYLDVKLRVTDDVIFEYKKDEVNTNQQMEKQKVAQEDLQKGIAQLEKGEDKEKLQVCLSARKKTTDETANLQEQRNTFQMNSKNEKTAWEAEIATLKEKLATESPICQYLKPGSSLPGTCPEKKEEPKPEPPKPEEKKPAEVVPIKEEGKVDAPKAEEVKPDAPKPEEAKQEAPK